MGANGKTSSTITFLEKNYLGVLHEYTAKPQIICESGARFTKNLKPKIFLSASARFTKHLKPKIFLSAIQLVWHLRKS